MAVALVQSGSVFSGIGDVSSWVDTWPVLPQPNNLVLMSVATSVPSSGVVPEVTLTQTGVVWKRAGRRAGGLAGSPSVVLDHFYATQISAQADITFTVGYDNPSHSAVCFAEYSANDIDNALDRINTRAGLVSPIPAGPTLTTRQQSELWFASWASENSQNNVTAATNGFTILEDEASDGAPGANTPDNPTITIAHKIVNVIGNPQSDGTTVAADRSASIMSTYRAGPIPSGPPQTVDNRLKQELNHVGEGIDNLLGQFPK